MSDYQALFQSIFIGLIFSYLLAKLISLVVSFKDENITITRSGSGAAKKGVLLSDENPRGPEADLGLAHDQHETESMIAELGSVRNESLPCSDCDDDDEDDDWEGVESTELDEMFSAATAFVATNAASSSHNASNDLKLQLYGLYKIATEGPCSTSQPSALKMTARAKWQAWQKLGAMPPEEAMQKYIDIVTELYPTWIACSSMKSKGGDADAPSKESKASMGPVFSSFVYEEEGGNDLKMDAIHAFAREGDMDNLLKCVESGVSVNLRDSEGRTPLHWAVDRGHLNVAELLISKKADVNAKDNDGQTALHYAAVCEREALAQFLLNQDADLDIKDNDGNSPCHLSSWPWMQHAATAKAKQT